MNGPEYDLLVKSIPHNEWAPDNGSPTLRWCQVDGDEALPKRGFKIHVSAGMDNASRILKKLYPLLSETAATFKFACSLRMIMQLNMGLFGISQVGKVVTVYSTSTDHFIYLATNLRKTLIGETGPRPLSDIAIPESDCLYYRYGSFRVSDPLEDERRPGFAVPDGIIDPFAGARTAPFPPTPGMHSLFAGRYLIFNTLSQRGKGGVYQAVDFGERPGENLGIPVVLKEARQFGERDSNGVDAVDRLCRQAQILRTLGDIPAFPKVRSRFELDTSRFLTMDPIGGGRSLLTLAQDGNLRSVQSTFTGLGGCILESILRPMHSRSITLNDLSAGNILLSDDSHLCCADTEEASFDWEDYKPLSTSGYASRRWTRPSPERDVFALARLILLLANPLWHRSIIAGEGGEYHRPRYSNLDCVHRWCQDLFATYAMDSSEIFDA